VRDAYILDAVRTPIGKIGGALASIRPDDLAAHSLRALLGRTPALDPAEIGEVFFGDANGAGEDNRNVARMATLLAGLPTTVPGATVNRLCGSGMEAVFSASRAVLAGDVELAVAAGVESMTRAPWVVLKPSRPFPATHEQMWNSALGWRMVNPSMPVEWTISLGEGAEVLAEKYAISREEQDEFAAGSHHRASAAWDQGWFEPEISSLPGVTLERDECIRPDSTVESLGRLQPVFRAAGTVTAGNSSPMNDGSAAMLVGTEDAAARLGVTPLARILSRATSAVDPHLYGVGPVAAAQRALMAASLTWDDIDHVELNEAFAAQSLACLREWPSLDRAKVNPVGGAIALGHPLGCSGARIVTTLCHQLRRTGGRYGLAAMCIGVGQGIGVVVEHVA
jgi:acetyl-CoA acetyltransferase family protein